MTPNTAVQVGNYWPAKVIESYVKDRTQEIYARLASCSPEELPKLQGALSELKQLTQVPETARRIIDNGGRKESNTSGS